MLHLIFEHILIEEEIADACYHHYYAPELRRRKAGNEAAPVVRTEKLDDKAPYAVCHEIQPEVTVEFELKVEHRHYHGEDHEEYALEKLRGDHGAGSRFELDAPVGGSAVATACKETAQSSECVGYGYAYGYKCHRVGEAGVHVVLQPLYLCARRDDVNIQIVEQKVAAHAAYEAAYERHAAELELACFDVVIQRLEEHGKQYADGRCDYS